MSSYSAPRGPVTGNNHGNGEQSAFIRLFLLKRVCPVARKTGDSFFRSTRMEIKQLLVSVRYGNNASNNTVTMVGAARRSPSPFLLMDFQWRSRREFYACFTVLNDGHRNWIRCPRKEGIASIRRHNSRMSRRRPSRERGNGKIVKSTVA